MKHFPNVEAKLVMQSPSGQAFKRFSDAVELLRDGTACEDFDAIDEAMRLLIAQRPQFGEALARRERLRLAIEAFERNARH